MCAPLKNLFVGPFPNSRRIPDPALKKQWENAKAVWNNEHEPTFGIERVFRLLLVLSAYIFPGIYVRHVYGKRGVLARKLSVDVFVTLKLIYPMLVLALGWQYNRFVRLTVIYLGIETLFYIGGLMFLSDIYRAPISHRRSYLMFLMNYLEICLDFAVVYSGFGLVSHMDSSVDAVYFSCVTGFTVGYGDMVPTSDAGKFLVMVQCICSLFFITLALAKAVSSFEVNNARENSKEA